MNLKHLLSISFLYLSGTTHALATKVNIGMTNALIIIIDLGKMLTVNRLYH
jgi:hypothetical protein